MSQINVLDINDSIKQATKYAKLLTFSDVLMLSAQELKIKTGLLRSEADLLLFAVSKACLSSTFTTALNIRTKTCPSYYIHYKVSLGCPILDSVLGGGILTGSVTEISGESSSGKTQICLQTAIQSQLPMEFGGLDSDVAYICTEDRFPFKRYNQMVSNLQKRHAMLRHIQFNDRILINHVKNVNQMMKVLVEHVPDLIQRHVKVIIVDSVAGLFRGEYEIYEHVLRTQDLQRIGIEIWKIANKHGIAVVCVNQVGSIFDNSIVGALSTSQDVIPALGITWANVISNRILLSRTNHRLTLNSLGTPLVVRTLETVFSPYLPHVKCFYVVTENGVSGLKSLPSDDNR